MVRKGVKWTLYGRTCDTPNVFARVEPRVKEQAEQVLNELGIPMSNAVNMFLKQVVLQRGIPVKVKFSENQPIALGDLTQEEFDAEIEKGLADIENGKVYSAEEVEAEMKRDFGILMKCRCVFPFMKKSHGSAGACDIFR